MLCSNLGLFIFVIMKTKLHLFGLIVFLGILTVFQDKYTVPNQELIVEFSDKNISQLEVNTAIFEVQKKLKTLQVTSFSVGGLSEGKLKITYYTTTSVYHIKQLLKSIKALSVNMPFSTEDKQGAQKYNVDVFEINSNQSTSNPSKGLALETKFENNRFSNPLNTASITQVYHYNAVKTFTELKRLLYKSPVLTGGFFYNIPEVRAGPIA